MNKTHLLWYFCGLIVIIIPRIQIQTGRSFKHNDLSAISKPPGLCKTGQMVTGSL